MSPHLLVLHFSHTHTFEFLVASTFTSPVISLPHSYSSVVPEVFRRIFPDTSLAHFPVISSGFVVYFSFHKTVNVNTFVAPEAGKSGYDVIFSSPFLQCTKFKDFPPRNSSLLVTPPFSTFSMRFLKCKYQVAEVYPG